jgi:hypothetical protein
MKVILMKVVDIDFQNTVIPYFHRMPLKRKTKHMALDGSRVVYLSKHTGFQKIPAHRILSEGDI